VGAVLFATLQIAEQKRMGDRTALRKNASYPEHPFIVGAQATFFVIRLAAAR
jgi:hypothetical protein